MIEAGRRTCSSGRSSHLSCGAGDSLMKVLFVGPYPPPHGGISVHVWSAHMLMKRTGQQSNVLNIDPGAPRHSAYIKISGGTDLLLQLLRHVCNDWRLDVHTNGHNPKSWFIGLACGLA